MSGNTEGIRKNLHERVIKKIIDVAVINAGALELPLRHHFQAPGKGSRSQLIKTIQGEITNEEFLTTVCAVCECIHEASLVHDDLQDRDEVRRSNPTVWKKFGDDAAILLGDHLIVCASTILLSSHLPDQAKLMIQGFMNEAVSKATNGQFTQLGLEIGNSNVTHFYQESAANKTGAFFAFTMKSAYVLKSLLRSPADHPISNELPAAIRQDLKAIELAGQNLGIGYQIYNDCKNLTNAKTFFATRDWQQQIVTAPLIILSKMVDEPTKIPLNVGIAERVLNQCKEWQSKAYADAELILQNVDPSILETVKQFGIRFRIRTRADSAENLSAIL